MANMGMPKLSKVREILLYSETVTASDIQRVARQYLTEKNMIVVERTKK